MPEASQFIISHKELTELLIKHSDVHEGKWLLWVGFGLTAGNFGPNASEAVPGAIVGVAQIGIQRADGNTPNEMTVDAAVVNPKRSS